MKRIGLLLVVLFMGKVAFSLPGYWDMGSGQGIVEYALTNSDGNTIRVSCNDGGMDSIEHGVSLYLKKLAIPSINDDGDRVRIEFLIDGDSYYLPEESRTRAGENAWYGLSVALSKASSFDVFWNGEFFGNFESKNTDKTIATLSECEPMAGRSFESDDFDSIREQDGYQKSGFLNVGEMSDYQIELESRDVQPLNPEGTPLANKRVSHLGFEGLTMGELNTSQISLSIQYLESMLNSLHGYESLPDIPGGPRDNARKEAELLKREMADLKEQYAITLAKEERLSDNKRGGVKGQAAQEKFDAEKISSAINKYANSYKACVTSTSPFQKSIFEFTLDTNLVSQKLVQAGLVVKKVENIQEKGSNGYTYKREVESWVYSQLFDRNYYAYKYNNQNLVCDKQGTYKMGQIIAVSPRVEASSYDPAYIEVAFTLELLNLVDKQGIFYELQKFLNDPKSLKTHVSTMTVDHGYDLPFLLSDGALFYTKVYITDQGYVTSEVYNEY